MVSSDVAADFIDYFHVSLSAAIGHAPLLTFAQKAAKLPGIELVAECFI